MFVRGYLNKLTAGCSTHYSDKPELASWSRTAGESFQVRIGPNYKRTKAKSASAPSLYECVGVDIFQAESKIDHIARCIKLPLPKQTASHRRDVSSQRMEQKRKAAAAALARCIGRLSGSTAGGGDGRQVPRSTLSWQALMAELPDGDFEDEFEYVATSGRRRHRSPTSVDSQLPDPGLPAAHAHVGQEGGRRGLQRGAVLRPDGAGQGRPAPQRHAGRQAAQVVHTGTAATRRCTAATSPSPR